MTGDDYFWAMAGKHRLITIKHDGQVVGLCAFFLVADESFIPRFYHRPLWETPEDDANGSIVYIDKLLCYMPFTRWLWIEIEAAITAAHPHWQQAVWYRPTRQGDDRRYTYQRRFHNVQIAG